MISLDEFIKDKAGCYSIESGFAVWEVKNSEFLANLDIPEVHIQLFIMRGSIDAVIDDNDVVLRSDSLIDILHGRMSIKKASLDISAIFIFTTEAFVTNLMNTKPPFSVEYIMQIIEQPVLLLNHNQSMVMRERLELVMEFFRTPTHYHQTEMLKCALWMVYLEMSNIFMHQCDDAIGPTETDRKRALFMKFVKMLPLYVRSARSVGFYASKLCVSCQYLERVIKALSGQTAFQWIQRSLIGEVNQQLKDTDKPIQQIADEFGFPDQATFTKYYKRSSDLTPSEYRNRNIV
jgi:AraC family transcriptional regulator, transcriptional activator of pobA